MTAAIRHRGPDSSGHHSREHIHLGARRLRIIDLRSGDQPISNETGDKVIVFNGEIYNYRELRTRLIVKGHVFQTETDTETVLHLYEEYGPDCVQHLRGMFAFAIEDDGRLFLARDRLGIKPLYFTHLRDQGLFFFASEIKALLRCPEVDATIDRQAVVDKMLFTHLPTPATFFRSIETLPPGQTLSVSKKDDKVLVEAKCYYRPRIEPDPSIRLADAEEELEALLNETIEGHLLADVDVALLLSGGLDSGLIASIMDRKVNGSLRAFTSAVGLGHPDMVTATSIAKELGIEHETLRPSFDDYVDAIPDWLACQEVVSSLSGLSSMLLCRQVGAHFKVCLNGEGSDEVFGGYSEFSGELHNLGFLKGMLQRLRGTGLRPSPELTACARELLAARKAGRGEYLLTLFRYHQGEPLVQNHLEHLDKSGMAASVEIRVPFMDHVLVDFVNRLPLEMKVNRKLAVRKYILRRIAARDHTPVLTDALLRSKLGMPQACNTHRQKFKELCDQILPPDYLERHELGPVFPNRMLLAMYELFRMIFEEFRGEVPEGFDTVEFLRSQADSTPAVRASVGI